MSTFLTLAVTLRRSPWREHDRHYTFYSPTHGKFTAVSRGARKVQSKLAGHLEPFAVSEVMVAPSVRGRNSQLGASRTVQSLPNLRSDLLRIQLGSYCLEVVDRLTELQRPDARIFDLLIEVFDLLNSYQFKSESISSLNLLVHSFTLKLLDMAGYRPELSVCAVCRKAIVGTKNIFFSDLAGAVCQDCKTDMQPTTKVHQQALIVMTECLDQPFLTMLDQNISPAITKEISVVVDSFYQHQTESKLQTKLNLEIAVSA